MANQEVVDAIRKGKAAFDEWRVRHPGERVNLSGADLSGVNMPGWDLGENANLEGTNLAKSNLEGARLVRARLTRTNFQRANLTRADLSGSQIDNVAAQHARLEGAILDGVTGSSLNAVDTAFGGASMQNAKVDGVQFGGADIAAANFSGSTLRNAGFGSANRKRTDPVGATFRGTFLRDASFSGATLTSCDFSHADLRGVHFTEADLRGATLRSVKLGHALLENAVVEGARIDRLSLENLKSIPNHPPFCGLQDRDVRTMQIEDGYAELRRLYGGFWAALYFFVMIVWLVPLLFIVAKGLVLGTTPAFARSHVVEIPLLSQIWGYANSGRLSPHLLDGTWSYPAHLWPAVRFWGLLLCHVFRITLVVYTKSLEHEHVVTGFYPDVVIEGWSRAILRGLRAFFWTCLGIAIIHAIVFLRSDFPATISLR